MRGRYIEAYTGAQCMKLQESLPLIHFVSTLCDLICPGKICRPVWFLIICQSLDVVFKILWSVEGQPLRMLCGIIDTQI